MNVETMTMKPLSLLPLAVLSALLFVAPVSAADRKTEARLAELEQRMARADQLLQNQALIDMAQRMEEMQQELRELRGENERLAYELESLKKRQRELYLDIDRRMQEVEAGGVAAVAPASVPSTPSAPKPTAAAPAGTPKTTPAPSGAKVATAAPAVASAQERDAYKSAFNLLKQGRYDSAITAFNQFLSDYPKSGYAANAQYWLGEAHYVSKDYHGALTEFQKVLGQYPDSNKVPDASLKLGFTYYELGQWEPARKALTEVTTKFAGTTVARLADQRLKRMKREGH